MALEEYSRFVLDFLSASSTRCGEGEMESSAPQGLHVARLKKNKNGGPKRRRTGEVPPLHKEFFRPPGNWPFPVPPTEVQLDVYHRYGYVLAIEGTVFCHLK